MSNSTARHSNAPIINTGLIGQMCKVFALIDRRFRGQLALLLLVTTAASLLEVFSITAVFPLFEIMLNPDRLVRSEWFHRIFGDTEPRAVFLSVCIGVLILFIIKSCVSTFSIWLKWNIQSRLYQNLSGTLLKSYLNSSLSFHLGHSPSELLRNLGPYVSQTTQYGFLGLVDLISDGFLCVGIFLALVYVDPVISSLAFLFVGTIAAIYIRVGQPFFLRWGARYKAASAKVYQIAMEPLIGIKTIKVLGCEKYFEDQYRRSNTEFSDVLRNNAFAGAMPRQVLELLAVSSLVGMIVWAILEQRDTATLIPVLAVFAASAYRIMPAIVRITSTLQNFRFGRDAIEVLYADIMRSKDMAGTAVYRSRENTQGGEIVLKHATFSYASSMRPALDDINLVIRRGEVVAFVGSSGAGKTTLADVILGLHRLESGSLSIDGASYSDLAEIPRGTFGYVPQDPFLIDDSIRRNIALGLQDDAIDEVRLRDAVKLAALEKFVAELPDGLQTHVGDRGVRLSGGQRQRIGIARAMYSDPEVLVFDEATSSIDPTTEFEITDAIKRLHGLKTIIVIAHRLSTVRECDNIFFLNAGRIVDAGTYEELIKLNDGFAAMVKQMDIVSGPAAQIEQV